MQRRRAVDDAAESRRRRGAARAAGRPRPRVHRRHRLRADRPRQRDGGGKRRDAAHRRARRAAHQRRARRWRRAIGPAGWPATSSTSRRASRSPPGSSRTCSGCSTIRRRRAACSSPPPAEHAAAVDRALTARASAVRIGGGRPSAGSRWSNAEAASHSERVSHPRSTTEIVGDARRMSRLSPKSASAQPLIPCRIYVLAYWNLAGRGGVSVLPDLSVIFVILRSFCSRSSSTACCSSRCSASCASATTAVSRPWSWPRAPRRRPRRPPPNSTRTVTAARADLYKQMDERRKAADGYRAELMAKTKRRSGRAAGRRASRARGPGGAGRAPRSTADAEALGQEIAAKVLGRPS